MITQRKRLSVFSEITSFDFTGKGGCFSLVCVLPESVLPELLISTLTPASSMSNNGILNALTIGDQSFDFRSLVGYKLNTWIRFLLSLEFKTFAKERELYTHVE
ncbi:hypothetical protein Pla110_42420 [Polystyrenella longa]|uniref:Uncharacterized protein n=1 Tax=Polystyrenella longa TaxID=2528007 RepID=A0A518CTI5_9PLAN|nr:hypothetical protein Pla110_42420 [Polystyrenella longa]